MGRLIIKHFLHFQIALLRKVPGNFNIFLPSNDPYQIIKLNPSPKPLRNLKLAQWTHIALRVLEAIYLLNAISTKQFQLTGDNLIRLSWEIFLCFFTNIVIVSAVHKHQCFIQVLNSLYTLDTVKSSFLVKLLIFTLPFFSVTITVLLSLQTIYSNINPVTELLNSTSFDFWCRLQLSSRIIVVILHIWIFAFMAVLGGFMFAQGLWTAYTAIYVLVKHARNRVSRSLRTFVSLETVRKSVRSYRMLLLYTSVVNDCFQDLLALPFKASVMGVCVVLSTVLLDPKLRSTSSLPGILVCVNSLMDMYGFMAFGYYFPGLANQISKGILTKLTNGVATMRKSGQGGRAINSVKRDLYSCRDVRIMIGSVNYYEKGTALNLLEFLVVQTITMVLMF